MNAKTVEEILAVLANKLGQPTAEMMTELTKHYKGGIAASIVITLAFVAIMFAIAIKCWLKFDKEDCDDRADAFAWGAIISGIVGLFAVFVLCLNLYDLCTYIASPKGYVIARILSRLR